MSDYPLETLQQALNVHSSTVKAAMKAKPKDYSMADYSYEVIMRRIKEFEDGLDYDHEVGAMLAYFGQSLTLSVTSIGYSNPSTLVFHGFVDGKHATLIQHMSQLNFLLIALPKAEPDKPPRRIGFALPNGD